jgi:hypothetical protein
MKGDLGPVTGTWPPEDQQFEKPPEIPAHEGFDKAFEQAIAQAADKWHPKGSGRKTEQWASVELWARVDIWNPGGIGQYSVKLNPESGPPS